MTIGIFPLRVSNAIGSAAYLSHDPAPDPRQFEEELARRGAGNAVANPDASQSNAIWKPNADETTPRI
ncbi:hypothetical protein JDN40_09485 [Rhodomicrobium vannielii ATCC 17100]|uniref:hypothetical protein n=1 Tax=Rhodomicrobium vannielii TaxID=1069 RepID=UPI0019196BF6|nr:hypothetical protein [Rhodomicrobium vannielii]MBJ7534334.1 hypothetical protein [Rhodomicrobium vannielii ATCC 17100]